MSKSKFSSNGYWISLTLFVVVGIVLRLWHWSSQIILDDEWHALNFVFNRSFIDVLTQQGLGANSIPINVYSWIVLNTVGWSEFLLRLPSMAAGLTALLVLPILVRRIWGDSVACIAAALFAVSPVVIFYSRIMRPYAPVMLLAISSILFTMLWIKEGRRRNLVLSALCGSFAIYYHLYSAIPVGVPYIVITVAALKPLGKRLGLALESKTPFIDILAAGGIMAVIDGVLVVIPNVLNPWWSRGIHNIDRADFDTVVTVLSHVSGTRNPLLISIVVGLLLLGLAVMIRRSRITGVAIAMTFFVFIAAMAITTQDGTHAGIQVTRYGIAYFPLSFVTVAVALAWIGEILCERWTFFQRRYLLISVAAIVWLPFLWTSPLRTTYAATNNFTNHSAYQYRYEPILWQLRSPERDLMPGISLKYSDIPPFYLNNPLLAGAEGIIEYPMLIGDQLNLYYYYQHFHQLPVIAGFVSNNNFVPIKPGNDFVFGEWPIDSVLGAMPEPLRKKSSWDTMADLNNISELQSRYKGWLVIIHRDTMSEIFQNNPTDNPMSLYLVDVMTAAFGNPVFLDGQLAAWKIK